MDRPRIDNPGQTGANGSHVLQNGQSVLDYFFGNPEKTKLNGKNGKTTSNGDKANGTNGHDLAKKPKKPEQKKAEFKKPQLPSQKPVQKKEPRIENKSKSETEQVSSKTTNLEALKGLAKKYQDKLEEFGELAEKASLFEMVMAGLGLLTTRSADWFSYFLETFGEFVENMFVAGRGDFPDLIRKPLSWLAKIYRIKTDDGKEVETSEDIANAKDKINGALNSTLATIGLLNTTFRTIPAVIKSETPKNESALPWFDFLSTKILPVINAGFMWGTGAGKRHLANLIQNTHYNGNKATINNAWTSGVQDYYCGANSFTLMLRQALSMVSPRLAHIAEPIFAYWISGASLKEGINALSGSEDDNIKYSPSAIDTSFFGKGFYNIAKSVSSIAGVKLPSLKEIDKIVKNPLKAIKHS